MNQLRKSKNDVEAFYSSTAVANIPIVEELFSSSDSSSDSSSTESFSDSSSETSSTDSSYSETSFEEEEGYTYNGETYVLNNTKFLQRRYDELDPTKKYKMQLCAYKCILVDPSPYLLYLTTMENDALCFPTIECEAGSPEESVEDTEERLMEAFKTKLFHLFPPTGETNENIYEPTLFKGFFINEDVITMVYDATNIRNEDTKENQWITPYEIFVLQKVHETPIDASIPSLFKKIASTSTPIDKSFYQLAKSDGSFVKSPYVLFMCRETSLLGISSLENVEENEYADILPPIIHHEKYGNYTFFSSLPINNAAQRYAVFADENTLFIEPEDVNLSDTRYSTITFIDSIQLWCVKSPENFIPLMK
jgi:hypothetical protein